ncbi:MAG: ABC transporter ATP-binding protein [Oscillospiraceae bacterium]|nr:ABC transporter ATP-binding protein [Oscillospiraceae bacterium]
MTNILELKNFSKSYPGFSIKDVSFTLPKGYICGFVGQNGAGKTTILKSILGFTRPDSGTIELACCAEEIGVVMEAPMYVDEWTVAEVEMNLSPFYPAWDCVAFARYLEQFALDRKKKIKALSRGMKMKIQLAVALSHGAKLLILDEPTSGLDPLARDEVCDLLREFVLDESRSVLFSSHITSDLEKTADYINFLIDGTIVYAGTKDALLEKYVRVAGGLGALSAEQKRCIIGYREHGTGFEGMCERAHLRILPQTLLAEAIALDDIFICMNKGAKLHE